MLTIEQANLLLEDGGSVVDPGGNRIGKVARIFLDDETGRPEWATVRTRRYGGMESFVPLDRGELIGSDVAVPFDSKRVKGAPRVSGSDGHLDESEKTALVDYYEIDYDGERRGSGP